MEKISSARAKFRSFLSSNPALNSHHHDKREDRSASNAVSLFNLHDVGARDSSSFNPEPHHHLPSKSISMGRLAHDPKRRSNLAVRLFQNIRAKLVRRRSRRDKNKIVDTTDFSAFVDTSNHRHQQLKSCSSLGVNVDVDVLNSFLGSRSNSQPRLHIISPPLLEEHVYEDSDNVFEEVQIRVAAPATPSPIPIKCLTKELDDLLHYGWYWAGLSKDEAEDKLKGQPDGAFVVRDSSSDHYLLSLSFNCNSRTLHTRIEYRRGSFSFYSSDADSFPTVAELIEHCMAFSEFGVFCYSRARRSDHPSYPVRLTKPISRFTEVKSLLYLSRFVLRQYVRLDLVSQLPLPPTLVDYVSQQRYIY